MFGMIWRFAQVASYAPFVWLCVGNPGLAHDEVRLTNGEWPPYFSENLEGGGLGSQIVREAFKLAGVSVEYGFFPWKRAYVLAETGEWHGSVLYGWSEEREKIFYYSDAVFEAREVFFHRKERKFDWASMRDLANMRVGANVGYFYGPEFHNAAEEGLFDLDMTVAAKANFGKLIAGRIDLYVDDEIVGLHELRNNFPESDVAAITIHPKPVWVTPLYLLLSRKDPANAERTRLFNLGLRRLRQNGRFYELLARATAPNSG